MESAIVLVLRGVLIPIPGCLILLFPRDTE